MPYDPVNFGPSQPEGSILGRKRRAELVCAILTGSFFVGLIVAYVIAS